MRSLIMLLLVPGLAACAASAAPEGPSPDSVRARLSAPTKLLVSVPDSSGSLTASRYTHEGWQDGSLAITIANGELDARVAASGNLEVSAFSLNLAPIDIPESVFGKAAQLQDVRIVLAGPHEATTTWADADTATATAMVSLDLSWTIVVDGNAAPLGTQHLAPLPIDVELTGSGEEVDASIGVHATGELWSWADLLKLEALDLELTATTAF
jgi:hypothetical protein